MSLNALNLRENLYRSRAPTNQQSRNSKKRSHLKDILVQ